MRISIWFVMAWVVGLGMLAIGASVGSYVFVRDRAAELDSVLDLPDPPQLGRSEEQPTSTPLPPTPTETPPAATTPGESAPAEGDAVAMVPTDAAAQDGPVAYNDPRRVSVLLLGIDQRAGETGPFVTDTIMLLMLDPVGDVGAMLSIPRDLWVEYPGMGTWGRINGANIVGDEINYPGGGGPAYATKAVEKALGIAEIDYYVVINFEVFNTVIDAVGPIEVCPTTEIHDTEYPDGSYGYITVHFDPVCQELDAERLLQYARTRHGDSDIARSERQQEVILAVREKVLSAGGVLALLPEATHIWESMQANITTTLSFEEMVSLALKAQDVPSENIRQGQISFAEVEISSQPDGDVLVPIGTDLILLLQDLLRPAGEPSSRGN